MLTPVHPTTSTPTTEGKKSVSFPMDLSNGHWAVRASSDALRDFQKRHFIDIFPFVRDGLPKFYHDPIERVLSYHDIIKTPTHYDHLFFLKDEKTIGWFMGEAQDDKTYQIQNFGILPPYQNKYCYTEFLKLLLQYLEDLGFEKVFSLHIVNNNKVLAIQLKQGFVLTSMEFNEDMGNLVRLTYFIDSKRREHFDHYYG